MRYFLRWMSDWILWFYSRSWRKKVFSPQDVQLDPMVNSTEEVLKIKGGGVWCLCTTSVHIVPIVKLVK